MNQNKQHTLATYLMDNPHLLALLILIILAGGFSAINSMPRLEDPVITNRNPLIITAFPGASAARVEAEVTERIEEALKEVPEIKKLNSVSRTNISLVAIELADQVTRKTNREVFSRIRDKLNDAARLFPPDAREPFFDDMRGAGTFTLITSLSWESDSPEQLAVVKRHAENLADSLRNVSGTQLVRIYGGPNEEILVEVDPDKLAEYGLSIAAVAQRLRNADVKIPAGALNGELNNFLIEVDGAFDSAQHIANVTLFTEDASSVVRIGDIARVRQTVATPPTEIAYTNGRRTLLVAARVDENRRVDRWTEDAQAAVNAYAQTVGKGIVIDTLFAQNKYTSERLATLTENLILGGVVVLVVIFFSMGWRASWIVGSALPLTAAMTLFIVTMTGGKLHQMSIFGMIIALGLLIDNAIVVSDEVQKYMQKGHSNRKAVALTLKHLFAPLLASTLTTILAFAPILLLPGNAGDFVSSIGSSVIIAISSSFFIAMTIIASLTGFFGRKSRFEERLPQWLVQGIPLPGASRVFTWLLQIGLRYPILAMGASAAIPIIGFVAASTMGVQFFPRTDRDMFEIKLWLAPSSSIYETQRVSEAVEAVIRENEEVNNVHWIYGASFPSVYYNLTMDRDNSPQYAQGIIEAIDFTAVKKLIPQLQATLDQRFPQAQILVRQFAQGPPAAADVEFRIVGPNIETLQNIGERIRLYMMEHPAILHTQVTMPRGEPKLWIQPNEAEINILGLELNQVSGQLQGNLQGFNGGSVLQDIESLPVNVRFADTNRNSFEDLQNLRITSPLAPNDWVPLNALGNIELRPTSAGITSYNGERVNSVLGFTRNDALPIEVTQSVLERMEAEGLTLPPGYRINLGGDTESQSEAVGNLVLYLPVLILLNISILILSFRSVMLAGLLGVVAFLSVGVGLLATWSAGFPLSFNTILGSLGLVGLAFNSSIVVLASIRLEPAARAGDHLAIVKQVLHTSRHLISTTLTTIGSFIPLLVFVGGDFWPPLAIVLAGGVGGSTLLAMVFTPSAYCLFLAVQKRLPNSPSTQAQHA